MREKKTIAKLAAKVAADGVEFPKRVHHSFYNFRQDLAHVLSENDLGGDWDWDEASQTFCASWSRRRGVEGFGVTTERHVDLDPRKPLAEEVGRLLWLKREFEEQSNRALALIHADEIKRQHEALVAGTTSLAP